MSSPPWASSAASSVGTSKQRDIASNAPQMREADAVLEHLPILGAQIGVDRQKIEDRIRRLLAEQMDRPRRGKYRARQMPLDGLSGIGPGGPVARHRMAQERRVRCGDEPRQVGLRVGGTVPAQPDQGQLGDFGQHDGVRLPATNLEAIEKLPLE